MSTSGSPSPAELAERTFAFARDAEAQKDWTCALERWHLARRSFPDQPAGYLGAAVALRELGRAAEADALIREALERFPNDARPWVGWAALAHGQSDWTAAAERWASVRVRFPQEAAGYSFGVAALQALGRAAETEAVLAQAIEYFPHEGRLLFEYAVAAAERSDWPAAIERWGLLRSRFPEQPAGFVAGAAAFREHGHLDEAEALLAAAILLFPDEQSAAVEYGWSANHRRDWPDAVRRWEALRGRYPDEVASYCGAAQALRQLHRFDEAEVSITDAMQRLPGSPEPYIEHAWVAQDTRDWSEAVRRWEAVRARQPDHVPAYAIAGEALAEAGRFDEAESLVAEARERFPESPLPFAAAAKIAGMRGDNTAAISRWTEARERFPGEAEFAQRLCEAQLHAAEAIASQETDRR